MARVVHSYRMFKHIGVRLLFAFAILAQILPLLILPTAGFASYLSPDETAVAVSAVNFGLSGRMGISEPLLAQFPWLHPRSFVSIGDATMAPVGFLGLPMVVGIFGQAFGELVFLVFAALFVLSVIYPLIRFTESWHVGPRLLVVSVWLSFPTVILYANRGLFPNLNAVCLTIWAAYLIWRKRSAVRSLGAGLVLGLALAIRPVEVFWMLPWIWLAWQSREKGKHPHERKWFWYSAGGVVIIGIIYSYVAYLTYGDPFAIGYWMRDAVIVGAGGAASVAMARWPFGFHPMNVWFNVKNYLFGYLAPWTILTILAAIATWKQKRLRRAWFVGAWTIISLILVYGQAIYQDHVGLNVTSTGNSFLRYLIPLAPVAALAIGALAEWFTKKINRKYAYVLVGMIVVSLYIFGAWTALSRDDEGVLADVRVRKENTDILFDTMQLVPSNAIILSDRSDKIFFPAFTVASPLPPASEIYRLLQTTNRPVELYTRTLDPHRLYVLGSSNISVDELLSGQTESLYSLGFLNTANTTP